MMNKELLTVAEFAKKAGKTKQAIYKQLNNRLKPFVQMVDGRKYIHANGLKFFYSTGLNNDSTDIQPTFQPEIQPTANQAEIEFYKKQIAEQEKTIDFQRGEIERLTKLLENQQILLLNEQQKNAIAPSEEEAKRKGFWKRLLGK